MACYINSDVPAKADFIFRLQSDDGLPVVIKAHKVFGLFEISKMQGYTRL